MMGIPNYDAWKLTGPIDVLVDKCRSCGVDLYEGQEVYYDGDFMESFCDKDCYKKHVIDHIDDYIDVVIDELGVRKKVLEKERV